MKHKLIIILAFATLALAILPVASAAGQQLQSGEIAADRIPFLKGRANTHETLYILPAIDRAAMRVAQAERILASTVRLEIRRPDGTTVSHATVAGGRYLITHNHYPVVFSDVLAGPDAARFTVTVRKVDGNPVLRNAPLAAFDIAAEDPEALILDFRKVGEIGFFDFHGVPSAAFRNWDVSPVQSGSEAAQVNWDGSRTFVQWTQVSFVDPDPVVPGVELEESILLGASGGGVFIDGYHIGNNWLKGTNYRHAAQDPSHKYSVAAINSETILSYHSPYERILLVPR